ncbi:MAG TPA: WYL domain-containing protein [Thermodesulfobium narugense]|nr:MAG: hypothetical protein C0174_01130 [Thermodesulfobium narugense]HEM56204.1 WYL domain-containing protein [Thermodesulfobium narugense]
MISKIYNLEILNKIKEFTNDDFCNLSNEELRWLKYLINTDESGFFFNAEDRKELKTFLADINTSSLPKIIIKNKPKRNRKSWSLLEPLFTAIFEEKDLILRFQISDSEQFKAKCFPYKIEFEFYKDEWYLLWLNLSEDKKKMKTPFASILSFEIIDRENELFEEAEKIFLEEYHFAKFRVDKQYLDDLKRILLTLIDFKPILEKDTQNSLIFKIKYKPSEEGYLLQKFRQLGKRAIILEPRFLVEKMLFTYTKSLERYSKSQS